MKMVFRNCAICSADDFKVIYPSDFKTLEEFSNIETGYQFSEKTMKTGRIVKCNNCGVVYVNPYVDEIEENYTNLNEDIFYERFKLQKILTCRNYLKQIERFSSKGKLLDIGCATGIFLEVAKEKGWQVEGIELAHWAVLKCRSKGLKVYNQPLEKLNISSNSYDLITLWGVIEHLINPREEILQIKKILMGGGGGILALYTCDIDSITAKCLGKKWWSIMGQHLYYFSKKTITHLLEDCGFEILKVRIAPLVFSVEALGHSLKRYPPVYKLVGNFFKIPFIGKVYLTLRIPGEMLVIARKK